ncbi:Ig-like V-type domain-containing protein FAM187A isoform X2 [Haplochromis burtoni]|uniref:Ig-like V-type domain-containing protein FAM187A isoform X2 n=1 Tax=Haplochromis burtoni TaxID=8153 RepID=UPI0003BD2B19|nr:Ig-like V-type domain-containing protein FAM187A isoform X2 [Haplochromis burtoni]
MPLPSLSPLFLLFLTPKAWSYEAPEDKQDMFARTACPAFLTFTNAAYLSGVTVELPCLCKPEQVQSVVWFFRKHLERSEDTKALTDHHGNHLLDPSQVPHSGDLRSRFSIRLFSLLIFRAGPDDAGIYICGSAHKDFFYGYDLDIQEAPTLSFTNRLASEASDGKRGQSADLSALYRLFTSFQPWSVCDRCGVPGEQVRAGLCYIRSRFLNVRYRRANQTVVSCSSGAVPRAFGLKQSRVAAKLEVRSCHMTCPSQAPPSKLLGLMSLFGSRCVLLLAARSPGGRDPPPRVPPLWQPFASVASRLSSRRADRAGIVCCHDDRVFPADARPSCAETPQGARPRGLKAARVRLWFCGAEGQPHVQSCCDHILIKTLTLLR